MSDFLKKVKGSFGKQTNELQPPPGVNPAYSSFAMSQGGFEPPSQNQLFNRAKPLPHVAGKPGGGWDEMGSQKIQQNPSSHQQSAFSQKQQPQMPQNKVLGEKQGPKIQSSSCDYEKKLIEDLTAPGGVRSKPPDKVLQDFVNRCKFLDESVILDCLLDKIQAGEGNSPLKALYIIQALVNNKEYEKFRQYLTTKKDIFQQIDSPISLQIIDIIEDKVPQRQNLLSSVQQQPQAPPKVQQIDLIGVEEEQEWKPQQQQSQIQQTVYQPPKSEVQEAQIINLSEEKYGSEALYSLDFSQTPSSENQKKEEIIQKKEQLLQNLSLDTKDTSKPPTLAFPTVQSQLQQQQKQPQQQQQPQLINNQYPPQQPYYPYYQHYQLQTGYPPPYGYPYPNQPYYQQQQSSYVKPPQADISKMKIAQVQFIKESDSDKKVEEDFKDVFSFK